VWAVTQAYKVGPTSFQIRTNSVEFANWLEEVLSGYKIDVEEERRPDFSVYFAEAGKPGKRFHLIYEGTRVLVRALRVETVAHALLSQLEIALLIERDEAIYAQMSAFRANGVTGVVPPDFLPLLETVSKRELERAGLVLPVTTTVAIDPATGELMPVPHVLDIAHDAFARLAALESHEEEPRVTVDRPVSVDVLFSFSATIDPITPLSKAEALYRAASHSLNFRAVGGAVGLNGMRKLVDGADCWGLSVAKWTLIPKRIGAVLAGDETYDEPPELPEP
jgi:hypothetical protein